MLKAIFYIDEVISLMPGAKLYARVTCLRTKFLVNPNKGGKHEKIMFDSNAFSSLLSSDLDWTNFFSQCENKFEFYVTAIQIEELTVIPDSKKELRIQHMLCLCRMRAKMVPNILVVGYGRLGFSVLADGKDTTYEDLLFESRSNVKDAMIGEAAKREGCILVTDDARFIPKLNKVGIPTMTFDEFKMNVGTQQPMRASLVLSI